MIRKMRKLVHLGVTCFVLLQMLWLPTTYGTAHAAPQAPLDTPTPLGNDIFASWLLSDGMLYWSTECFGGEFRNSVTLKRKAVNSAFIRILADVGDLKCLTFRGMAADATGIYYYNYATTPVWPSLRRSR
ncbi:MAG: hypothetical protein U0350_34500 [Caldilineaceae bacterium]